MKDKEIQFLEKRLNFWENKLQSAKIGRAHV